MHLMTLPAQRVPLLQEIHLLLAFVSSFSIPYTQTAVVMLTLLVSPSAPYDVAVEHVAVAYAINSQSISTVK
jgi:hypothetical protein